MYLVLTCMALAMPLSNCANTHSEQSAGFISTYGKKILDGNGNEFIIKAINAGSGGYEPDAWNWGNPIRYLDPYKKMTEDDYEEIASLGFNAVRLCMDYKHFYFDAWTWNKRLSIICPVDI